MTEQAPVEGRCDRCKQIRPLFLEGNDPLLAEEDETWALLLRGNMRAGARRRADVETVAAIAAASGMSGAADNATGGAP